MAPAAPHPAPDLLASSPRAEEPAADLRRALTFAFASGGASCAAGFAEPQDEPRGGGFRASCFAESLFIADLVRGVLEPSAPARALPRPGRARDLAALLCHPPRAAADVETRRGILAELRGSGGLRAALSATSARLAALRGQLESPGGGAGSDPLRRRLELLDAIRGAFVELEERFGAATSALARLASFARTVRASEAYSRLERLLADEAELATVDLRVALGRDGEVRRYELVRVASREDNPFRIPWHRRLRAALSLLFLGVRVRQDEMTSRLVDGVFESIERDVARLLELERDLDFYLAALAFEDRAAALGLPLADASLGAPGERVARRLEGLWNPLLLLEEGRPVPADLVLDRAPALVLVTGPNSGGKTRLVEALGIAQLFAQGGLRVPAARASLPFASGLYASLRLPSGAVHREGQLGTELLRIRELFEQIGPGGLVVIDELCAGTNPAEGEELFELVLSLLAELGADAFVTTHFLRLAARLAEAPGKLPLELRQVALDPRDRPTFRFVPGVAATSLARKTAERLGVTREELGLLVAARLRGARDRDP